MAAHVHRPRPARFTHRAAPRSRRVGATVGLLAATGLLFSMMLPWRVTDIYPRTIPVEFLWNRGATAGGPSLLVVLVPLAVLLVIGAVAPAGAGIRLVAGLATLVLVGVFAFQLSRVVHGNPGFGRGTTVDTGFYVAALAGIGAFVSALLTPSSNEWRESTSDVQTPTGVRR